MRLLRLLVDLAVVQGRAPVGRALEHGQVAGGLGDLLDGLHAGGAGADHRDPFAGEAHRLMRPARGVVGLALEGLDALDARHGRRRQGADRGDQEARAVAAAVLDRDVPVAGLLPVVRRAHAAVEADVGAQAELVGDEVEIAQRLGLGREMLGPVPFVEQLLGKGIAVGVAFGIEARARIAIPVPGAADAGAGLEHEHPQAELAQTVELVEARNARADDEGVVVLGFGRGGHLLSFLHDRHQNRALARPRVNSRLLQRRTVGLRATPGFT